MTVVIHETEGKITFLFFNKFDCNKELAINKFADEPLFTKIEFFVPKKFENFFQILMFHLTLLIVHLS